MGSVRTIGAHKWPKQTALLRRRTKVMFHYQPPELTGTIVRCDAEEPHITIILLDDGRFVLASECQHSPMMEYPCATPTS